MMTCCALLLLLEKSIIPQVLNHTTDTVMDILKLQVKGSTQIMERWTQVQFLRTLQRQGSMASQGKILAN